jgi:23S rRNA pseudouridine955/2504/2580 synthase
LHAFSLEFDLLNGSKKLVEAPYPKDFQALMKQLSENLR